MTPARTFRGCRFPAEVILWALRWYLQFPLSYRDLERMPQHPQIPWPNGVLHRRLTRVAPPWQGG